MANNPYSNRYSASRGEPTRWQARTPKGVLMSDEAFGALESFPDVRCFRCSVCGSKQFVLADARVTEGVKARWQCDCTPSRPGARN